jgi:hypothetical protein
MSRIQPAKLNPYMKLSNAALRMHRMKDLRLEHFVEKRGIRNMRYKLSAWT